MNSLTKAALRCGESIITGAITTRPAMARDTALKQIEEPLTTATQASIIAPDDERRAFEQWADLRYRDARHYSAVEREFGRDAWFERGTRAQAAAATRVADWGVAAEWLRNHYQDYDDVDTLCAAMVAAAPAITDGIPVGWRAKADRIVNGSLDADECATQAMMLLRVMLGLPPTRDLPAGWAVNSGAVPVAGDVLVDVMFRKAGAEALGCRADRFWWRIEGHGADIIGWRVNVPTR